MTLGPARIVHIAPVMTGESQSSLLMFGLDESGNTWEFTGEKWRLLVANDSREPVEAKK
jgi:hypothetical protein